MAIISIISVNLNNSKGLSKTLLSVFEQTYKDIEFIVIDGGSTDQSISVIKNYQYRIDFWTSEPDKGIYHAMNKGIQQAKGDYCLFLNSGDWLTSPTVLEEVFSTNPTADIVSGDVYFFDTVQNKIKWHVQSPEKLTAKTLFLGTLPHQATFIKRELFSKVGPYNENLKIASDWLFWVEALLQYGCSYEHFSGVLSYFNMDGISCNPNTDSLPKKEQLQILNDKYPLFIEDYNQLANLESASHQWHEGREYIVYTYLKKLGIIKWGVLALRIGRFLKRKFERNS